MTENAEQLETQYKEFIAEQPPVQVEAEPLFKQANPDVFEAPKGHPIKLDWKILGLRTASNDKVKDAVAEVFWEVTGTDGDGNEGKYRGSTQLNFMEKKPEKLTDYNDLTEDEIMGWIKGTINLRFLDHINSQIMLDIQMKRSIIQMDPSELPWKK